MPTNWVYVTGSSTLGGIPIDDPAASGLNLTWSGLEPGQGQEGLCCSTRPTHGGRGR